ncbi:MAG TPA: phospho-N-acetylmuramoyl-pentapeptide-transferase [Anaerolineales bacterium]|nr:phospho-N-acetylmuramoyl-pentapeptide-transferase [Anaerolineales bacterium]
MNHTAISMTLAGFSFVMTVIWGPPFIRALHSLRIGESIRVDGPERHFSKLGTPTMGGVLFLVPVVLITLLLNAASLVSSEEVLGNSIFLPLGVMLGFAFIGAVDDWSGLRGDKSKAMKARTKFVLQWLIALLAAFVLYHLLDAPHLYLPGFQIEFKIGLWYIPVAAFIIVATSNAVNITDGLDGLSGLIAATAFATYGGIALLQGQIYLGRFCFTLVGSLFGFLWFNVHPAELFMGDTGSLALGATLGTVAMMTGQWAILPVVAIIPVSELLSVMIQVGYFKMTKRRFGQGRRLFKMSPLHHHFELSGWSETQVVQRFWLVSLLAAMIGVALAIAY